MRPLSHIVSDRSGNVLVMVAGSLGLLGAISAFAIDTASLYLTKRTLQGAADAAALAAATSPAIAQAAAQQALVANRLSPSDLVRLDLGSYSPDPSISPAARFAMSADASAQNAAQVTLRTHASSFFARLITGTATTTVSAKATAARVNVAAFSIGSRLAAEQGGVANMILSGLAGTDLSLSAADYNSLVSSQIDVLSFAQALRTQLSLDALTFADVLDARVTLPQAVSALAGASTDPAVANLLQALSQRLPSTVVPLSTLIDLGPLGGQIRADSTRPVSVDAYSFLRALLELGGTHQAMGNIALALPGVGGATIQLQLGQRAAHSPWLAVGTAGRVTVRTAQVRILVDTTLMGVIAPGIASMRLPLYLELAEATASLASVSCSGGRTSATASLDVTPSIGTVAVGQVDRSKLSDFSAPLAITPASLISTPLVSIVGSAILNFSSNQPQRSDFSAGDITNHVAHTTTANGLASSIATSLAQRVALQANVAGTGLSSAALTSATGALLQQSAPALDQLLAIASAVSGVRIGQADTWIDGVGCGTPVLVL